ncbi:MAG: site-specific integrase [Bacteroidales bacterium]|nr:site-specific integrase [Bacteroidales bacterium]
MIQKVNTAIILETRYKKKNKKHPVKLRVTYRREQKYYSTMFDLTAEDFEKVQSPKARGEYKQIQLKLQAVEAKALQIISDMPVFTFNEFEKYIQLQFSTEGLVKEVYDQYIKELETEGRYSYSQTFICSRNSIFEFCKNEALHFIDINEGFLKSYEKWMLDNEKSISTVGIYLRPLRAIFNYAQKIKLISEKIYPFGKNGYQIPTSRNIKKALTKSDLVKLLNYSTIPYSPEDKAKDYWIFSYLCNGINIKDIALLKYRNIKNESIIFIRAKTASSRKKDLTPIEAVLTDEVRFIIDKWGNKPVSPDNFIFPILKKGLTQKQTHDRIHQAIKTINKYMKKIGSKLGIPIALTTYVARHTYSTIMVQAGMSVKFISEQLGHSSTKTTDNYIGSFDFDEKKKAAINLTRFED